MRNGLMMVYIVLAVLFVSLLQPLTILFSLPLSIAGAIVGLLYHHLSDHHARRDRNTDAYGHRYQEWECVRGCRAVEAMRAGLDRTEAIIDAGRKQGSTHHHDDDRDGCRYGS